MRTAKKRKDEAAAVVTEAPADSLDAKREKALATVLTHATLKEAAEDAGCSVTTLWRYMQEPVFAKRLREARRELVSHATIRLQNAVGDSVRVLHEIVKDEKAPAAVRVTAAVAVYKQAVQVVETDALETRVEALEEWIRLKLEQDALKKAAAAEGEGDD
jgi:molybdenum-dependent DNA-binding transcriptional regulator ModE